MKIAHVNTHTYGGASIVARRIHEAMLTLVLDSVLITRYGIKDKISKHYFFQDESLRQFVRKSPPLFRLAKYIQRRRPHPNLANRPAEFELFSPLVPEDAPIRYEVFRDREIIHLHWVSDFIAYESFFRTLSTRRFVWTLHDMNPFTGGCHHSDGCMKFETTCLHCPQLQNTIDDDYSKVVQDEKIKALEHLADDQLVVVSPSSWLAGLSKKSKVLGRFKHHVIPNPSFREVSFHESRDSMRKRLGLTAEKKIVLFVSDNLNNPRKGINLLFQAMRLIPGRENILLVGIGHKSDRHADLPILYTGILSDPGLMACYFYCADIFVTPSLAENSPLVVIEALTCGTPVVASDVGGIPDLVRSDNGLLFPVGDISALANAIGTALFSRVFDRDMIMRTARSAHDPLKVAAAYIAVYESLMKQGPR